MVTHEHTTHRYSKLRWLVYALVGLVFGVFDLYFQQITPQNGSLVVTVGVTLGIWLIPLVPVALYEVRTSRSEAKAALASMVTWSVAIISYYLYMGILIVFVGMSTRPEVYIGNRQDPYFLGNIQQLFLNEVVGSIIEWLPLAVIGGSLLGFIVGWLTKRSKAYLKETGLSGS